MAFGQAGRRIGRFWDQVPRQSDRRGQWRANYTFPIFYFQWFCCFSVHNFVLLGNGGDLGSGGSRLWHSLSLLGQDDLEVSRVAHVG